MLNDTTAPDTGVDTPTNTPVLDDAEEAKRREQEQRLAAMRQSLASGPVPPEVSEFARQDMNTAFQKIADAHGVDQVSKWSLMRPDVAKETVDSIARGGIEAWNGTARGAAKIVLGLENATGLYKLGRDKQEEQAWEQMYARPTSEWTLEGDGKIFGFDTGIHPRLTISDKWTEETFGAKREGIFGLIESTSEFATEFASANGLFNAAGKGLAGLGRLGEWMGMAKAPEVVAALAKPFQFFEGKKLTQGAAASMAKALLFDDVRQARMTSYISELGGPSEDAWHAFITRPVTDAAVAVAKGLRPESDDGDAMANLKAGVEDFLVGIPFSVAGIALHAWGARIAKSIKDGHIGQEAGEDLMAHIEKEYAGRIKAEAAEKLPADEAAYGLIENADGTVTLARDMGSLKDVTPHEPHGGGALGEVSRASGVPPEQGLGEIGNGRRGALGKVGQPPPMKPETNLAGALRDQAETAADRTFLRGPTFNSRAEAQLALAAVRQHVRAVREAVTPLTKEQIEGIKTSFEEYFTNPKGDPRTVEQILEKYAVNKKYLANGQQALEFIKAIVDVAPEGMLGPRGKVTSWEAIGKLRDKMFAGKPTDTLIANLERLGVEGPKVAATIDAARIFMAGQQKELYKLSLLMGKYPDNKAYEEMFVQGVQALHDVHALFSGVNAANARALGINKRPIEDKLVEKFFSAGKTPPVNLGQNSALGEVADLQTAEGKKAAVEQAKADAKAAKEQAKADAKAAKEQARAQAKEDAKNAPITSAEADGSLVRNPDTGAYDLGPTKLTREDAIALGRLIAMNKNGNVEGLLKLISMPGPEAIKKAVEAGEIGPSMAAKLMDRVMGARVDFILSAPVTHISQMLGGVYKTVSVPAELAWYGLAHGDGEALKKGGDLALATLMHFNESLKMAASSFNEGRGFIDAAQGTVENVPSHMRLLSMKETAQGAGDLLEKSGDAVASAAVGDFKQAGREAAQALQGGWKTVDTLYRLSGRGLQAEDEFFKQLNYRANVQMQLLAQMREEAQITGRTMSKEEVAERLKRGMEAAIGSDGRGVYKDAIDAARESTFTQDMGFMGNAFKNLADSSRILKFHFPFVRAPYNIFDHVWQMTPGLNFFNQRMREDLAAGGVRAMKASARAEMGVMLYGAGAALVAAGQITGAGPTNPEMRKYVKDLGFKPYSIRIGDEWYSYRRGDPYLTHLGLLADFWQISGELDGKSSEDFAAALTASMASSALSRSYMSSVESFMSAISSGQPGKVERLLQADAASFVPEILNKANPDPYYREVNSILDAMKAKSPWHSQDLEPHRNVFGQVVMKAPGIGNRLANAMTFMGSAVDDDVAQEMIKLGRNISDIPDTKMGSHINLRDRRYFGSDRPSDEEGKLGTSPYERWNQLMGSPIGPGGKTLYSVIRDTMRTEEWKKLTDDSAYAPGGQKFNTIARLITTYRNVAWGKMLSEYPKLQKALAEEKRIEAVGKGLGRDGALRVEKEIRDLGGLLHRTVEND